MMLTQLLFLLNIIVSIISVSSQSLPTSTVFSIISCNEYPNFQTWKEVSVSNNAYTGFSLVSYPGSCIDSDFGSVGTTPWIWNCDASNNNQWWSLTNSSNSNNKLLKNAAGNTCMQVSSNAAYSTLSMQNCNTSNTLQQWSLLSASNGSLLQSAVTKSLCLTASTSQTMPNCSMAPFNTYPYCNQELSVELRVNDLIQRMTLDEKVKNLQNNNPGIPRLAVPKNLFHEMLHGVLCGCGAKYEGNTGCPTSFPHALLLGATFNRSLWREVATAISTEARAFANQGITGLFYWAPDINLFRDPRWYEICNVYCIQIYLLYVILNNRDCEYVLNFQGAEGRKFPVRIHF